MRNICPILIEANKFKRDIICPSNDWVAFPAIGCVRRDVLHKTVKIFFSAVFLFISNGLMHHSFDQNSQLGIQLESSLEPLKVTFILPHFEVWKVFWSMAEFKFKHVLPEFFGYLCSFMSNLPYLFVHLREKKERLKVYELK